MIYKGLRLGNRTRGILLLLAYLLAKNRTKTITKTKTETETEPWCYPEPAAADPGPRLPPKVSKTRDDNGEGVSVCKYH